MSVHTTKQKVFNIVWEEFVVKERQQAIDRVLSQCVYRGSDDAGEHTSDNDMRCAVGVCIPDDMYDPELEDYGSIGSVHIRMPDWYQSVFNGIDVNFLSGLQRAHDLARDTDFTADISSRLRVLAQMHTLTIPGE